MLKGKVDYFAKSRLLVAIRNNINPASLFPSLAIGIVIWMMALLMGASFSALIFQGRLAGYFASGIGMFLVAAVSLHVLTAFLGSETATIPTPQSTAAVILGAISVNLGCAGAGRYDGRDPLYNVDCHHRTLVSSYRTVFPGIGWMARRQLSPLHPLSGHRRFPGGHRLAVGAGIIAGRCQYATAPGYGFTAAAR